MQIVPALLAQFSITHLAFPGTENTRLKFAPGREQIAPSALLRVSMRATEIVGLKAT